MEQLTISIELKSNVHRNWNNANLMAHRQAGMVRSWTAKSPERAPADPGSSNGTHKNMLMKFVSTGS
eukprot:scaffold291662_cov18-Tisochrysis_lutea.AAC.1